MSCAVSIKNTRVTVCIQTLQPGVAVWLSSVPLPGHEDCYNKTLLEWIGNVVKKQMMIRVQLNKTKQKKKKNRFND